MLCKHEMSITLADRSLSTICVFVVVFFFTYSRYTMAHFIAGLSEGNKQVSVALIQLLPISHPVRLGKLDFVGMTFFLLLLNTSAPMLVRF